MHAITNIQLMSVLVIFLLCANYSIADQKAIFGCHGVCSEDEATQLTNTGFELSNRSVANLQAMQELGEHPTVLYMHGRMKANDGGQGFFSWEESDLSNECATDPFHGIYVPSNIDPTCSKGARVRQKTNGIAHPEWWGAVGDGVTNDTVAVQAAINKYSVLNFSGGKIYLVGEIILPPRDTELYSHGGVIHSVGNTFVFKQKKRGFHTVLDGLTFTGNSIAFDYDSENTTLPYTFSLWEYRIENCSFLQDARVIAIRLYGAREGVINKCYFDKNAGIYSEFAINTKITDCRFRGCNFAILSKLGSEGLIVSGCTIIGGEFGIRCERTTGVQISNSMLDYVDAPIYLQGASDVLIQGNYISTRTVHPAVIAEKYHGYRGVHHILQGNIIRDNYSGTGSACIRYTESDYFNILDNICANYASNGIEYANCTLGQISRNTVRQRLGQGVNAIQGTNDNSTVLIFNNVVSQPIKRSFYNSVFDNFGFKTEASGEAIVNKGSSSVDVIHGLDVTPTKNTISLIPASSNIRNLGYSVSEVTNTIFTITLDTAVEDTTKFAWTVRNR